MFSIHDKRAIYLIYAQIGIFLAIILTTIPVCQAVKVSTVGIILIEAVIVVALCATLMTVFLFLRKQEQRLEEATECVNRFMRGDSSVRLSSSEEGELAKFFEEINHMALSLHTHLEAEKRSKDFLKSTISDISHQLKTPIAAIRMYNEIMSGECNSPETIEKFTQKTEKSLDRMERLIQNLLKITKLDAGTIVLEKKTFDVDILLEEISEEFQTVAESEGKQIIIQKKDINESGSEGSIEVYADRNWTAECVQNLVQNALNHMESGCRVTLSCYRTPVFVRITVADDGSGIHPEDIHHIFKRFYRSRFSKNSQGVGLGLSLVKSIMEAHGGTVCVASTCGEGSVFYLDFPNH